MTASVSDDNGATWKAGLLLDEREESPALSTRLAAELHTCVAKISGAQLPTETKPSADVAVQVYKGESPCAAKLGVTVDRLEYGAYRVASGEKWLALIGDDTDFTARWHWRTRFRMCATAFKPAKLERRKR